MSVLKDLLLQRIAELEAANPNRVVDDALRARLLDEALALPAGDPKRLAVEAFMARVQAQPSPPVSETTSSRDEVCHAMGQTSDRPSPPAGSHIVRHHGAISYDSLSYDPPPDPKGWCNHLGRHSAIPALANGYPQQGIPAPRVPAFAAPWARHPWSEVVYPSVFRRDPRDRS